MRLVLSDDLFCNEYDIQLISILERCLSGRLFIEVDKNETTESWITQQSRNIKEKWESARSISEQDKGRYRPINTCIVKPNTEISNWSLSEPVLTIEEAVDIANSPFKIILENNRNDRSFLMCASSNELRTKMISLQERGLLEFVNAGGLGELKKQVEETYSNEVGFPIRHWTFFDSDSSNSSTISATSIATINLCHQYDLKFHCLNRRAIENYVPLEAIIEKTPASRRSSNEICSKIETFKTFSTEQRNHYHMKKGIKDISCFDSGLYDDMSNEQYDLLANGFGGSFADIYTRDQPSPETSADYEEKHQHMRNEGALAELEAPLSQIKDFLRGIS